MNKYQIIAFIGKASTGKDTIQQELCARYPDLFHSIVSCTTRPPRQGEENGKNYHFLTTSEFTQKVLNGEMLEATEFREWFYGTAIDSLSVDKINVGVFNPAGIEALLEDNRLNIKVYEVFAPDKQRLMRYLKREDNPNCAEMCRRFFADEKDFANLEFDVESISNDDGAKRDLLQYNQDFKNAVRAMWAELGNETPF